MPKHRPVIVRSLFMQTTPTIKFMKVFGRDLQGKHENAIFINIDHILKIEAASCDAEEVSSIITLTSGERREVAGTPEDLLTHERYFYPKKKDDQMVQGKIDRKES